MSIFLECCLLPFPFLLGSTIASLFWTISVEHVDNDAIATFFLEPESSTAGLSVLFNGKEDLLAPTVLGANSPIPSSFSFSRVWDFPASCKSTLPELLDIAENNTTNAIKKSSTQGPRGNPNLQLQKQIISHQKI